MSSGVERNKEEIIQYVGVSDLNEEERAAVNRVTTEGYEKVKRDLQNLTNLLVHIKTYNKEGDRKKYSVHLRVDAPTKINLASSRSDDWEIAAAMHKAFDDVRAQIRHRLHSDVTRPRG